MLSDINYINQLIIRLLKEYLGQIKGEPEIIKIKGDASNRSYFRVPLPSQKNIIVMKFADEPLKSEEASDEEQKISELPFINVQKYLKKGDIPVPEILHVNLTDGILFLEDLGDVTMEKLVCSSSQERCKFYPKAIDLLIKMQSYTEKNPDRNCIAWTRTLNEKLLLWEFNHFYEYMILAWTGKIPSKNEESVLKSMFQSVTEKLSSVQKAFAHRDFQSRNLMIQFSQNEQYSLRLIDFQDALIAPYVYDITALLRDSYVELTRSELTGFLNYYYTARKTAGLKTDEFNEFYLHFLLQTIQRKLKDAGRFVFIDRVKGNPLFLPSIPASLRYAKSALEELPEYKDALDIILNYLGNLI